MSNFITKDIKLDKSNVSPRMCLLMVLNSIENSVNADILILSYIYIYIQWKKLNWENNNSVASSMSSFFESNVARSEERV